MDRKKSFKKKLSIWQPKRSKPKRQVSAWRYLRSQLEQHLDEDTSEIIARKAFRSREYDRKYNALWPSYVNYAWTRWDEDPEELAAASDNRLRQLAARKVNFRINWNNWHKPYGLPYNTMDPNESPTIARLRHPNGPFKALGPEFDEYEVEYLPGGLAASGMERDVRLHHMWRGDDDRTY